MWIFARNMNMANCTRLCGIGLAVILLLSPAEVTSAQDSTDTEVTTSGPFWYAAGGLSQLIGDLGEDGGRGFGLVLGGGLSLKGTEVGLVASTWPNVRDFRVSSLQAQGALPFAVGLGTSFDMVMGLGYSWDHYLGDAVASERAGASAHFGLRFRAHSASGWGGRGGLFVRADAGGWSGEWRTLVSWTQRGEVLSPETAPGVDFGARFYHMAPVGGPWVFAEPGFAAFVRRPVTDRLSAVLTLAVFHWQIPGEAFLRSYLWDTRALVGLPAAEWNVRSAPDLKVRVGPAVVAMGEGPDNGVIAGPDAELELGADLLGLDLAAGVGWMWLLRGWEGDPDYGGDQHGFMLFGALAF